MSIWTVEQLNIWIFELWNIGTLDFGTFEHWNIETLEHWNIGTLEHWNISTCQNFNIGTLEHFNIGYLNIWTFQHLKSWHSKCENSKSCTCVRAYNSTTSQVRTPIRAKYRNVFLQLNLVFFDSCRLFHTQYKTWNMSIWWTKPEQEMFNRYPTQWWDEPTRKRAAYMAPIYRRAGGRFSNTLQCYVGLSIQIIK